MHKGIPGYHTPDENVVTARRNTLKPPRDFATSPAMNILKSVPDTRLRSMAGKTVKLETTEHDDEGNEVTTHFQHHISPDAVHHEMKWRNLI